MGLLYGLVVCFLSCTVTLASVETYRTGIFSGSSDGDLRKYLPLIHTAAESKVDIVVLPSPKIFSSLSSIDSASGDNYDELVQTLSEESKRAGLYVVAHLLEKTICQSKYELVRSNLVFGRDGNVVSVYRKPLNNVANCTAPPTEVATFTTDFGVQFGLLMEEDLVLHKPEDLSDLKNFVVAGGWSSDVPFLSVSQFASSWAFTNKVNLVSSSGVFLGRNNLENSEAKVTVVDLMKGGEEGHPTTLPVADSSALKTFPDEDLSLYVVRPLDEAASLRGYKETVCHDEFCCEFYIKTSFVEPKEVEINYGLAASAGARRYGKLNIGAQTCAVFACAGLYKRSCAFGSVSNTTNVVFEKISIRTNSSSGTSQYPIILTAAPNMERSQLHFDTKSFENQKQIVLESSNIENVLSFGIFGREFSKDAERDFVFEEELSFKDEMQELFDYLWIRLRILIFVVSIYFLEMM